MTRTPLSPDELEVVLLRIDGPVIEIEANADSTRYHLFLIRLPESEESLIVLENFGTAYQVNTDMYLAPSYLAEKIGRNNERTGQAVAIMIEVAQAADRQRKAAEYVAANEAKG